MRKDGTKVKGGRYVRKGGRISPAPKDDAPAASTRKGDAEKGHPTKEKSR